MYTSHTHLSESWLGVNELSTPFSNNTLYELPISIKSNQKSQKLSRQTERYPPHWNFIHSWASFHSKHVNKSIVKNTVHCVVIDKIDSSNRIIAAAITRTSINALTATNTKKKIPKFPKITTNFMADAWNVNLQFIKNIVELWSSKLRVHVRSKREMGSTK